MIQYEYDKREFRKHKGRNIIFFDVLILLVSLFLFFYYGAKDYTYASANTVSTIQKEIITPSKLNVVSQTGIKKNQKLTKEQIEKIDTIYQGNDGKKVAYLTFDDGPSPSVTPLILDVLKQEQIPATFFLLGNYVEQYPELVRREKEEGHYIANHGYTHRYSSIYTSLDTVWQEYEQTEKAIQTALGDYCYHTNLFRFPGGSIGGPYHDLKQQAVDMLNQKGVAHVNWNALTGDAEGAFTKEAMLEKIKSTVEGKNVVVILMHDAGDKILTYEILPQVIQYLRENGYVFDTFRSLLQE